MKRIVIMVALVSALGSQQAFGSSYDDLNAGIELHNLKQWSASIVAFDKALAPGDLLSNQTFIAHMDRGQAHQALKQYEAALADYSACLLLVPTSATALLERADVELNMGKFAEAAGDLDTLIDHRPMLTTPYTMRAAINAKLGRVEQSREDSKKVLSLLPADYVRNIATGIIAWQAGETSVAEDNFSHATSQGPGSTFAWIWLALTKVRAGEAIPAGDFPNFDRSRWPAPIVSFFTGETQQDAVFAAAGDGSDTETRGRMCEANFYVGEWLLRHGNKIAAQSMIRKAADGCPVYLAEWGVAQTELAGFAR
jgi:tetratricopeptide (TPR) repeat protein